MKQIFRKTILLLFGGLFVSSAAWADDILVPSPVYFNDFATAVSGQDGIQIIGNGVFENDADARFGRIFHNDPTLTKAKRTNYLKLPDNVLSHSTETKAITIGFWVNVKDAADYWFSPIFSAYALSPTENAEASRSGNEGNFPMFVLQSRGLMQLNNGGYDNFEAGDNVAGTNAESTVWLDDKAWHYYTMTMTTSKAIIYIDGVIKNEWNIAGTDGHSVEGFFTYGGNYKYICLGGNQAWNWDDPDPAYAFDDFAVYNVALSKAQIDQIRANKLNRTVTGTQIGTKDCGTASLGAMTDKVRLYPGDSYSYSFKNYNNGGTANYRNFLVPVYNPSDELVIAVRADNWENMHHVGETWGSNAGCTSDFNWTNWVANMNGATVNMTVSFTAEKKYTMSSTITTVDGSTWHYSYTNDYTGSSIDLTSYDYIQAALSIENAWLDVLSKDYSAFGVTVPVINWSTYANDYALDFTTPIAGLTPYMVTGHTGNAITLSEVTTTVPAGTPLLLKGTAGNNYSIPVATSSDTDVSSNKLKRGTGTVSKEDGKTKYVLSANISSEAEFQKIDATPATVPAGKAYLEFNEVISARELTFDFNSETTAISELTNTNLTNYTNEYFNLAGQRVANPTKGLYIVNGKKVVIK